MKNQSLRRCEIVSTTDFLSQDKITEVLASNNYIKDYAYILHDKDIAEDGKIKKAHYHIQLRFKEKNPAKINHIAAWFNVQANMVSKIKGSWTDALLYLTHRNALDKYQYTDFEVVSNFPYDSEELTASKQTLNKEEIVELIDNGTIRKFNLHEHVSMLEYLKWKPTIDMCFSYRMERLKNQSQSREQKCIYVYGSSGTGKTTWAKKYAKSKGYSVYISSSLNDTLDNYNDEDCIILDDVKKESRAFSDLLKTLDSHTSSAVRSRYFNKILECKVIILTSVYSIDDFILQFEESKREPALQLKRRCECTVEIQKDIISFYVYDVDKGRHVLQSSVDNHILDNIPLKKTPEQIQNEIQELGFGSEALYHNDDM